MISLKLPYLVLSDYDTNDSFRVFSKPLSRPVFSRQASGEGRKQEEMKKKFLRMVESEEGPVPQR